MTEVGRNHETRALSNSTISAQNAFSLVELTGRGHRNDKAVTVSRQTKGIYQGPVLTCERERGPLLGTTECE